MSTIETLPPCPECASEYTYEQAPLLVCPSCGHEWTQEAEGQSEDNDAAVAGGEKIIRDAFGNVLQDGDTVTVIRDLKVKGGSGPIKIGTRVRNIRLIDDGVGDHDIDCKIDGFGPMQLKSSVVKKA